MNRIQQYQLRFEVHPDQAILKGEGDITIEVSQSTRSLFFLLYHDLKVVEVKSKKRQLLSFVQQRKFINENYCVNEIEIFIPQEEEISDQLQLSIKYEGSLGGYELSFPYVKDRITSEFSILRNDCLAYPILAHAKEDSLRKGILNEFEYDVLVKVPHPYVVAGGGILLKVEKDNKMSSYHYRSHKKMWRIDLTIGLYQVIEHSGFRLFLFHEDVVDANEKVFPTLKKAFQLFEERFGKSERHVPFTLIEIKEYYGSQVGEDYILMEEHGFKQEGANFTHLYHEVGHGWNPTPTDLARRTRFFDEAFASYFEALAIREFEGLTRYEEKMAEYRRYFAEMVSYDLINLEPISEYGRLNIYYNSYTKGAFVLAILHELMGEVGFNQFICQLIKTSKRTPVGFEEFQCIAEKILNRNLSSFMKDWIYEKTSSEWLISGKSMNEFIVKYLT